MIFDLLPWATRWHDFAEIVAAVATAIAVIVALVELVGQSRARTRNEERDRAREASVTAEREAAAAKRAADAAVREAEERRAQALSVIAWTEPHEVNGWTNAAGERFSDSQNKIHFVNASGSPVFDVEVLIYDPATNKRHGLGTISVLPGGAERSSWLQHATVRTIEDPRAEIRFRDLRGVLWARLENGELHELDASGQRVA